MTATEKAIDRALRGLEPRQTVPDPRYAIDLPTMSAIRDLAAHSGVAPAGRPLLIRCIRYYLGKGPAPTATADVRKHADWIRRRAWELVDDNRHRLPPVEEDRKPR